MTKENQSSRHDDRSEVSSQNRQEQSYVPKIRKTILMQERENSELQETIQDVNNVLKDKGKMTEAHNEKRVRHRHAPKARAERREAVVRRKVKFTYLALVIFSLVIIVLFAFLLKNKLRAIKELPTEPSGQQYFEENPRITLPPPEDTNLFEEGIDEDEVDPSNSEEPNSSDSSQP